MLSSTLLSPLGQTKIYLYAKPADMRKSFNGLHAIVAAEFGRDIRAGDLRPARHQLARGESLLGIGVGEDVAE